MLAREEFAWKIQLVPAWLTQKPLPACPQYLLLGCQTEAEKAGSYAKVWESKITWAREIVGPKPLKVYIGKVLPVNAHLVGYRLPLNSNADDACERGTEGCYQRARYTCGRFGEMLD